MGKAKDFVRFLENTWDDEVVDTRNKVKIERPKGNPNQRIVVDKKTNKYVGSFDLKKKEQAAKYKSMFKMGK